MQTRAMGPGAGWRWLMQGINLGRNNPKAIFGGAFLLLLTVVLLAFGLSLIVGGLTIAMKPGLGGSMGLGLLIMLPVLLVMAGLMVGYLRLIDAVEAGRAAGPMDVFGGFKDMPAMVRAIVFIVVLAVAQNALLVGLVAWLAPDLGAWYLQNMQASMAGAQPPAMAALPEGFGVAFVLILLLSLFGYAVQAIGMGQIALRQRGILGAITDGIAGAAKNLLPLLVLVLLTIAACILFALLAMLVVMIVGVLAKFAGVWLGILIGVPLYVVTLLVIYVVMFGVMYSLWRDVCGDGPVQTGDAVAA